MVAVVKQRAVTTMAKEKRRQVPIKIDSDLADAAKLIVMWLNQDKADAEKTTMADYVSGILRKGMKKDYDAARKSWGNREL